MNSKLLKGVLSVRAYTCLKYHNILTVDDLKKVSIDEISNFKNIERRALLEISVLKNKLEMNT